MRLNKDELSLIHFSIGLMLTNRSARRKMSKKGIEQAEQMMDRALKEIKKRSFY